MTLLLYLWSLSISNDKWLRWVEDDARTIGWGGEGGLFCFHLLLLSIMMMGWGLGLRNPLFHFALKKIGKAVFVHSFFFFSKKENRLTSETGLIWLVYRFSIDSSNFKIVFEITVLLSHLDWWLDQFSIQLVGPADLVRFSELWHKQLLPIIFVNKLMKKKWTVGLALCPHRACDGICKE